MNASQPGLPPIPAQSATDPVSAARRPFGLYMILFLLSLQALVGGLLTALLGFSMAAGVGGVWDLLLSDLGTFLEPAMVLVAVMVVVVGLWRYQLWAWYGMMLLLAYWMATDALFYFNGAPDYGSMVLNVAMVFYLNQREVRELFEARAQHEGASV